MGRDLEVCWSTLKIDPIGNISRLPVTFTIVSAANINTLLHTNLLVSFNKSKKSKFDSFSTFIAFPQQRGKHLLKNLNYNPAVISIIGPVWSF